MRTHSSILGINPVTGLMVLHVILLLGVNCVEAAGEGRVQREGLCIMWYNVENLFHPGDDTIRVDDPFTPGGEYHWTFDRYRDKLTGIARVIIAAGGWDPPDLVGICEVECAGVLEDLVRHPLLEPYGYSYLHRESPDHRGLDVACLYRGERIRLHSWESHRAPGSVAGEGTRDMIHLCAIWGQGDTLDLFLVHLVSRYSGAGVTARPRREQVERLLSLADSVCRDRGSGLLVMAGDYNDEQEGYTMEPFERAKAGGMAIRSLPAEGGGSYKYRGRWSMIDRFMVWDRFSRYRLEGEVLRLPALLVPDEVHGGMMPRRTFRGYLYTGGISDHLPIILRIARPLLPAGSWH